MTSAPSSSCHPSPRASSPQVGGVGATPVGQIGYPFRIDHDEKLQPDHAPAVHTSLPQEHHGSASTGATTAASSPAATPCYNATDPNSGCADFSFDANGNPLTINGQPAMDLTSFTADQQFQAGLACNGVKATPTNALPAASASHHSSPHRCSAFPPPAPGTTTTTRPIAAPQSLRCRARRRQPLPRRQAQGGSSPHRVNVTNKYALYNFLSTFSGTHYVTPRAITGEISYSF